MNKQESKELLLELEKTDIQAPKLTIWVDESEIKSAKLIDILKDKLTQAWWEKNNRFLN